MCKLTIKCNKCSRSIESMKWKIKRNNNALNRIDNKAHPELRNKLLGQNEGLKWAIDKLTDNCECEIIKYE